ncbi:hypothetical protein MAPG_08919 [Magnaporthiopsis poae ATCC 64411]|uniref:Uncharacterized protein n=1 Tax=Magnaporthiopsis poae (strain ATCC 64411 / 73-15) TaxID=644358 RepID=A0A0C4E8L0_MAGP6|nr:hypothetical protein MAPG_08919 [Magnaporthiopsis poae ATCC 64411]
MKKQSGSDGKKLLRDSWPLKMMAPPTLPRLNLPGLPLYSHQQAEDALVISGPREDSTEAVPIRTLPPPPRPVLVVPNRPAPQQSPPRPFIYEEAGQGRSVMSGGDGGGGSARRPSTARGRKASTDSTLAEILQSTERRLQEGTMTGVARRNRQAASPPKREENSSRENLMARTMTSRTAGVYGFVDDDDDDVPPSQLAANRRRTPSPSKSSGLLPVIQASPGHVRNKSEVSDISEPDSMFGDTTTTDVVYEATVVATRLTSPSRSPSRTSVRLVESPSTASSKSLSTLYSVDEAAQDNSTQATSLPSSSISDDMQSFSIAKNAGTTDPFVTLPGTPQSTRGTPVRVSLSGGRVVDSAGSGKLVLNRPPKLRKNSTGESSPTPVQRRSHAERILYSASPDGQTEILTSSPSRTSDKSRREIQQLLETPSLRTRMRSGVFPAPLLLSPQSPDDGERALNDEGLLPIRPSVMVTSPSTANTTPSFLSNRAREYEFESPTARRVVPPPHDLRVDPGRCSSPTLGEDDGFVSVVTPSPASSPALSQKGTFSPSQGVRYVSSAMEARRVRGGKRVVSTASSIYSQYVDDPGRSASPDKMPATRPRQSLPPCPPPRPPAVMVLKPDEPEVVNDAAVTANDRLLLSRSAGAPKTLRQEKTGLLAVGGSGAGLGGTGEKYLVTSTIAELRRMNSQLSSYSAVSSHPGGGGGNTLESPTIPQLRGGGFSPSARPVGTKNYLALGTISQEETDRDRYNVDSDGVSTVTRPTNGTQFSSADPPSTHTCPLAVWTGCTCNRSEVSALTGLTEEDKRFMDLKMPRVDFDRFSAGFIPEISERFLAELGGADTAESGIFDSTAQLETPRRRLMAQSEGGGSGSSSGHRHGCRTSTLGVEISPDRHSVDSLGLYDNDGFLINSPERTLAAGAVRSRGLRI